MINIEIVTEKINHFFSNEKHTIDGAEVIFNGRVRNFEKGKKIIALEYEHYEGMAELELKKLADKTVEKFSINDLFCKHRVGKVPIGEASLYISIWSPHRKEALNALEWFIAELKKHVPIWKWAIFEDGTREPTHDS